LHVVCFSVALFSATFLVHMAWWRLRRPRHQTVALLYLFFGALAAAVAASLLLPETQGYAPTGFWEWLHVGLFQVSMALAYIVVYSGLAEDSPSLAIISCVVRAGGQGRTREELLEIFLGDDLLHSRLEAMVAAGSITTTGTAFTLTPKGRRWARLFRAVRQLYCLNKGG
jgi:hypothetical protein